MFILICRNPKTRNWFRYETFYYLWVKRLSTWGERDTIFLCWLLLHCQLSTQPTHGARSAQSRLASPRYESKLSRSDAGTQLTDFFQLLKSSAHTSGAWRHPRPLVPITGIFILTSLNGTFSPRAWIPALMLHLTNPCTEPKGSHPNKNERQDIQNEIPPQLYYISTQFKCQKHFYFKQLSWVNKVKWFQVLLCINNNSIKHQSFIYITLNVKTYLFQKIMFSISMQFKSQNIYISSI